MATTGLPRRIAEAITAATTSSLHHDMHIGPTSILAMDLQSEQQKNNLQHHI